MDNVWNYLGLYLGLDLFGVCSGYPVSPTDLGGSVGWSSLLAAAFLVSSIVILLGCLCCRQTKGFQVFTDSTSNIAAASTANPDAAATEFTMFPPLGGSANQEVRFEPLPDMRPPRAAEKRPAAFNNAVTSGLPSAQDWFGPGAGEGSVARHQLQYVREMGRGWFGRVLHATLRGATPCAARVLREDASPADRAYFLHEAVPYRRLRHPNVLGAVGWCLEADPLLVLLEDCPNGDLKSFLLRNRPAAAALCEQGVTLNMACDIAAGLQHMHDHDFVHTDLAARNCLLASDLTVKVGDYGIGIEAFERDYYVAGDVALPVRWAAPETLRCTETTIETGEVTVVANVWSYGVVLWEIAEWGELPYAELTDDEVVGEVMGGGTRRLPAPTRPAPHQHDLYQLMQLCWSPALQRPALRQVHAMLQHLRRSRPGDLNQAFELRWDSLKPNSIPKTDNHCDVSPSHGDLPPSHGDMSPVRREMSPSHREISPPHHDMSPLHRDTLPVHRETSPSRHDMSPLQHDTSASVRGTSPLRCDVSPSHHDTLPVHHETSPRQRDISPLRLDTSPTYRDVSPSHYDSPPSHRDMLPSHRGSSPRQCDTSPSHRDTSPSHRDMSPSGPSPPRPDVDSLTATTDDWQADGYYRGDDSSSGSPPAGRWRANEGSDSDEGSDDEAGFEQRMCAAIQDLDDVLALASSEEVTAKVREKSRSVADLMVLTHIDQLDSIGSESFSGAFHAYTPDGGEGAFNASTPDGASGEGAFYSYTPDGASGEGAFNTAIPDSPSREAVEDVFRTATQGIASREAVKDIFHVSTPDSASKEAVEGVFYASSPDNASREAVEGAFHAATPDSTNGKTLKHGSGLEGLDASRLDSDFKESEASRLDIDTENTARHGSAEASSRNSGEENSRVSSSGNEASLLGSSKEDTLRPGNHNEEATRCGNEEPSRHDSGNGDTLRLGSGNEASFILGSGKEASLILDSGNEDTLKPDNHNEEATICGNEEPSRPDSGNGDTSRLISGNGDTLTLGSGNGDTLTLGSGNGATLRPDNHNEEAMKCDSGNVEKLKLGSGSVSVKAPGWNSDNVCDDASSVECLGQTASGGGDDVELSRRKRDADNSENQIRSGDDSVELSESNVGSESVGDLGFNSGKASGVNHGLRDTEAVEVLSGDGCNGDVGFRSVADASERNIVNRSVEASIRSGGNIIVEASERLDGDNGSVEASERSGGDIIVEASECLLGRNGNIEASERNIVNGSAEATDCNGDNGSIEAPERSGVSGSVEALERLLGDSRMIEASENNVVSGSVEAPKHNGDNGNIEALGFNVARASTDASVGKSGAGSDDNRAEETRGDETLMHLGVDADVGRLSETVNSRECTDGIDGCEKTSTSQNGPLPLSPVGRANSEDGVFECNSKAVPIRLLGGLEETNNLDSRGTEEIVPDGVELSLDNSDSRKGLSSSKLQDNADDALSRQLRVADSVTVPLQEIQLPDSADLKTISNKIVDNILQDANDILLGLNSNLSLDSYKVGGDIVLDAENRGIRNDSVIKDLIEPVPTPDSSENMFFKVDGLGNDAETGETKDELLIESPLTDDINLLVSSGRPENMLHKVSEVVCDEKQDGKELGQKNEFEANKGGGVAAKDMNGINASLLFIASEMGAGAFRESSEVSSDSNLLLGTINLTKCPKVDELIKVSIQDPKEVCELDEITIEDSKVLENVSTLLLPSSEFGHELIDDAKDAANDVPPVLEASELCSDILLDTKEIDNVANLKFEVSELGKATTQDAKEVGDVTSVLPVPSELRNDLICDSKAIDHNTNLLFKSSKFGSDLILNGKETLHENAKMLPKETLEGLGVLTKDDNVSTASPNLIKPLQNDFVDPKQIYSVVSLGPSEEYTMDYLRGLKTTYIDTDSEWDELVSASESVEERPDSSSEVGEEYSSVHGTEGRDKIIRASKEEIIVGTGKTRDDVLDGESETEECEPVYAMEREEDESNKIKENTHMGANETGHNLPIGVSEIEDMDRETEDGDRVCGSETEDGDRVGGSETEDDVPIGVSETEDDVPIGVSETEDGDRVGGSEMEDAKHSSPDEESSDSGFRDNKGSLSEDAGDERYNLEDIEAELEEAFDPPDKKNGWYLHPQTDDIGENDYSPYCAAADDESAMAALRDELCRQLPLANRGGSVTAAAADFPDLSEDEDDDTEYEDVRYSHYQAAPPLSPIPEEEGEGGDAFGTAGETVGGAPEEDAVEWGDDHDGISLQQARNEVVIGRFEGDTKEGLQNFVRLGSQVDKDTIASDAREKEERDRRFEEDIREALESHDDGSLESSSGTGTDPGDVVLMEDLLDGCNGATVVRLRNTTAEPCDEVLRVDTATDRATIVRSGKPDTHVAFVERRAVAGGGGGTFTISSRLDNLASCDVGFPTAVDDNNEAERIVADLLNSGLLADQASSSATSDYSSSSGRLESLDASSASPAQIPDYLGTPSPLQKLGYLESSSMSPLQRLDYLEPSSLSRPTNLDYLQPSSLPPLTNLDYVQPMTSPVAKLDYLGPSSLSTSANLDYLETSSLSPSTNLDYIEPSSLSPLQKLDYLQPMTSPVAKLDYLGPSSLSANLDYLEPSSLSPAANLDYVQPMTSPVAKLDYLGPASLSPLSAVDYFSPTAMSPIDRLDALEPSSLSPADQWDSLESTSPDVELDRRGPVPMSPVARLDFLMSGKYESANVGDGSVVESDASKLQFLNNNNSLPTSGVVNVKYSEPLRVDTECVKLTRRISFDPGSEEAELFFNTRLATRNGGETERLRCEKLGGKTDIKVPSVMSSEGKKEDMCPLPNNLVEVRRTELQSNLDINSRTEKLPNCVGIESKKDEPSNTVIRNEEDKLPILNISLLDSVSSEESPNSSVMEAVAEVLSNNLSKEAKAEPANRLRMGAKEVLSTPEVSKEKEPQVTGDDEEMARTEEELEFRGVEVGLGERKGEEEEKEMGEGELGKREEEPVARRKEEELGKREEEDGKDEEELRKREEEPVLRRKEEELGKREEEPAARRKEEELGNREEEHEEAGKEGEEPGKREEEESDAGREEEREPGREEEELASTSSMHDISFRGPGTDEMSTSFTLQGDEDEYAPDWESDTDDNSSSSGEFVWQEGESEREDPPQQPPVVPQAKPYSRLTEAPLQSIAEEEDEDDEESDDEDDDGSSSEASSAEFVPSAWDSEAAPSKSALRSAGGKQDSQRRVRFKRQKYHCVYEYPRESPSPSPSPGGGGAGVDYALYADWELLDEEGGAAEGADAEADWEERPPPPPQHSRLDFYKLGSDEDYDFSTGEFLVSSTARPFQEFGGGIGGNGCQFFPGQSRSVDDIQLEFLSPCGAGVLGDEIDTSPSHIAHPPLSPTSPTGLGGLRHTRDQLKLNLAPPPAQPTNKEMVDSGIESAGGTNALRTLKAALEVSAVEL